VGEPGVVDFQSRFHVEMYSLKRTMELGFYPLFEEKVGIVLLSGSEVGLESELSRRFEVP